MFPNHVSIFDNPIFFFDGAEIQPYEDILVSGNDDLEMLSNSIRRVGEDCCGYIESINVFYHTTDEKKYYLDINRDYVFAYFKDEKFNGGLPLGFLMKFLQYKCAKILFVYDDVEFFIEKTEDTYNICIELEKIYENRDFFEENVIKKVHSKTPQTILLDCFINLIKEYKSLTGMSDYKEKDDIDLLVNILKLKVK